MNISLSDVEIIKVLDIVESPPGAHCLVKAYLEDRELSEEEALDIYNNRSDYEHFAAVKYMLSKLSPSSREALIKTLVDILNDYDDDDEEEDLKEIKQMLNL